jgi:hypothetical protein
MAARQDKIVVPRRTRALVRAVHGECVYDRGQEASALRAALSAELVGPAIVRRVEA